MKKVVKLAVIRDNESDTCPFGLSVPEGCKAAGDLVEKMAPLSMARDDEEKVELAKANHRLFLWKSEGQRCKYAGMLFKKKDVVECNWGTESAGAREQGSLVGSPFYYKHFSGVGLDGLYTFPLGYYVDTTIDRPHYYGLYSFEGIASEEQPADEIVKESEDAANKIAIK